MSEQREPTIEDFIRAGATGTEQEWRQVKHFLSSTFAVYLGTDIEAIWEPLYEDSAPHGDFAFGFCSRSPLDGPLGLEWYGVISNNGSGHICAFVLLFAHDQRMIHHAGKEYLYFEFVLNPDGRRQWVGRGWASSEMSEWDGYLQLSTIRQRMHDEHK